MFVVAITRWGAPVNDEVQPLAELLGCLAYDLRLKITGPVPVVFAYAEGPELARTLRDALRARGHGAVACDAVRNVSGAALPTPREIELLPGGVRFGAMDTDCPALPWAGITALLRARHSQEESSTTDKTTKKFSLGKAIASSGMARSKTVKETVRHSQSDDEQVLYLVRADRGPSIVLRQSSLRISDLGELAGRTRLQNFETMLTALRGRCPPAWYDESLYLTKRKPGTVTVAASKGKEGSTVSRRATMTVSNAEATDLAVYLLTVALTQGQLEHQR